MTGTGTSQGGILARASNYFSQNFNFFRIHLTVFTLLPIIFSAIFYAANEHSTGNARDNATGIQEVEYIDSIFLCFSAMTVTGMATVNLSAMRPFQQVLLFILFLCGDYSVISLVMVLVRKRYFRIHCSQLLRNDNDRFKRTMTMLPDGDVGGERGNYFRSFTFNPKSPTRANSSPTKSTEKDKETSGRKGISGPINARAMGNFVPEEEDRLRERTRNDREDRNLSGMYGSEVGAGDGILVGRGVQDSPVSVQRIRSRVSFRPSTTMEIVSHPTGKGQGHGQEELDGPTAQGSINSSDKERRHQETPSTGLPHTRTIQIDDPIDLPTRQYNARQRIRSQTRAMSLGVGPSPKTQTGHVPAPFVTTKTAPPSPLPRPTVARYSGMGGFAGPAQLLPYLFPNKTKSTISRHFSKPALGRKTTLLTNTNTFRPGESGESGEAGWHDSLATSAARWMPVGLASLVVGRNSRFFTEELDDEELEQIGGVEYRALRLLSYAVAAYIFLFQAIPFAIIAIYFAKDTTYDPVFQTQLGVQAYTVNKTWTALFTTVSAYTGTGLTLTDQSMVPFSTSFVVIYVLNIVMLAGNHALPMMLRFYIWLGTKIWRRGQTHETLHFLLDHPRRCFLYLFPSHQTWFLAFLLAVFMIIEVAGFFLLQIGLPVVKHDGWTLFSDAVFQSLSVRASGFSILPITKFAPALLFLYVVRYRLWCLCLLQILMYVAIYPIAMSIRSTNVYEERSLGVFEHKEANEDEPTLHGDKSEVFSKYLAWHMRRQLAFDIWPLCLGIFLICMFERGKLLDPERETWFTIFRIIFDCTSAYSTIGLSLGTPNNNWSFCGEFGTASKLVMIGIMLRGRHRGLPVAIDRAILLPQEMARIDKKASESNDDGQKEQ